MNNPQLTAAPSGQVQAEHSADVQQQTRHAHDLLARDANRLVNEAAFHGQQFSRPAMVTPWGKCTASVKTMIPEETERLLRAHAARCGATESEVIRNMLLEKFHGRDMAEASLVEHFRSTVRTGTETLLQVRGEVNAR
jgi:hypothetical protein